MLFSVVIPMYNEREVIEACAEELTRVLEASAESGNYRYEILFSDDGSTDGCGEIVQKYAGKHPLNFGEIRVLRSDVNRGKGAAVRNGMLGSRGDWALFTDSDLAYGAEIIPEMLSHILQTGADLCIGSRTIAEDGYEGYTAMRKLASRTYLKLVSFAAGFDHTDSQCGIKLFRGSAARQIFSACETDGWAFDLEVLLRAENLGFTIEEYPVKVINHRESKVHLFSDSLNMIGQVVHIRKIVGKK